MSSFAEGNIFVTSLSRAEITQPKFLPLVRLAGAIVTTGGGITAHSAIVSRELEKPCIIRVTNALEALKNGDEVEVNADTGTITILNRQ